MWLFQQSESVAARRDLPVFMVDATDRVTAETGLTLTVEILKAGTTTFSAFSGDYDEAEHGLYQVHLAAGDLDTIGAAMLRITASGAATQFVPIQVVRMLDEVHLAKAALVNRREHTVDTGVDVIKDDDGSATLRTMTPSEADGVVTVAPS
jgi:hypothetical protein